MKKHTRPSTKWLVLAMTMAGAAVWLLATRAPHRDAQRPHPADPQPPRTAQNNHATAWHSARPRPQLASAATIADETKPRPTLRPNADNAATLRAEHALANATTRDLQARIHAIKQRGASYYDLSADDRALYDVAVRKRANRRSQKPASQRLAQARAGGAI